MNAAIVIETHGALNDAIVRMKELVRRQAGARVYRDDPPHCTVLAGTYPSLERAELLLKNVAGAVDGFTMKTTGMRIFAADIMADDASTVVLGLERSRELSQLQQSLADAFRALSIPRESEHPDEQWRHSSRTYGWPFVGDHWRPHCTIAALDPVHDCAVIDTLMAEPAVYSMDVRAITLWQVDKSVPTPRITVPFGGAQT